MPRFVAPLGLDHWRAAWPRLGRAQEYLKRGWSVVGTVRGRTALDDLLDRSGGRLEVETVDVVKPETNAVSQTADARKRITTRSRLSLTRLESFRPTRLASASVPSCALRPFRVSDQAPCFSPSPIVVPRN
jgi:hypothetical protein